jgi:hypothetical protein
VLVREVELSFFWHESVQVVLLGLSPHFIDVKVKGVTLNSWGTSCGKSSPYMGDSSSPSIFV